MRDRSEAVPELLSEIVRQSRNGDSGAAASLLNRSISLIQTELTKGNIGTPVVSRATEILSALLAAQQRGDWIGFADIVEYQLIGFWREHFSAPC